MSVLHVAAVAVGLAMAGITPTVQIAPGVMMPVVNLGGVATRPSNYSAFLEVGGVGLDTAYTYTTQPAVGKAVKDSKLPRDQIFITTKIPCCPIFTPWSNPQCDGVTPTNATQIIEDNLQQMGLEYVDLILLHWMCDTFENTMLTYQALEAALAAGKTRAIGISNFNASMTKQVLAAAKVKPAVNQCGYSIANHNNASFGFLGRDDATREFCTANGVWYQAYSPLGGLSGIDVLGNPTVKQIASTHNVSTAQIALRWVVQQPALVVTAAENPDYMKEDLDIFGFELTPSEMQQLAAIK
eukprot:m.411519 g.411519  ORF g.411519 m.411519 type:complete len:298 (-) comp28678_c0_seq1:22-915(-)